MTPVQLYIHAKPGDREYNALQKALELKPEVTPLGPPTKGEQMYRVDLAHKIGRYFVIIFVDNDGQMFVQCLCPAGTPPIEDSTRLPAYPDVPCYHSASVILHEAAPQSVVHNCGRFDASSSGDWTLFINDDPELSVKFCPYCGVSLRERQETNS